MVRFFVLLFGYSFFVLSIVAQKPVVIRIDKNIKPGSTIEINQYYAGKFKSLVKFKTDDKDSHVVNQLKWEGLYSISIKEFENPAEFIYNPAEEMVLIVGPELTNGSLGIENSKDNIAYSDLLKINNIYNSYLDSIQITKRQLPFTTSDYYGRCFYIDSVYESIANEKNGRLTYLQFFYPGTYTSNVLVPLNLIPIASLEERKKFQTPDAYLSNFYFKYVAINQKLLYHYGLENSILDYMAKYSPPNEDGIKKSISYILKTFKSDTTVSNAVSTFLIKTFLDAKKPELALMVMNNATEGCTFDLGEKQAEYLSNYNHVQSGNQVDDVVLNDINEVPVSLNNSCKKSDLTILLFWTSWCEHCKNALPQMKDMLKAYKGKVSVFAVSLDDNKEEWSTFISKEDLAMWTHVSELKPISKSTLAPRFMVTHTPTIYLLNKERKILAKNLTIDQLSHELQNRIK